MFFFLSVRKEFYVLGFCFTVIGCRFVGGSDWLGSGVQG